MSNKTHIANRIWEIIYPVCMYYVAITIGVFVAQLMFGAKNETYMLCKIIGSLVALPVVWSDYKRDLIMTGRYGTKEKISKSTLIEFIFVIGITVFISISLNNIISMSPLVENSVGYENASNAFYSSTITLELLGSALITPILEELLHRGVVYGRLRRMMGLLPSVLWSSFIFAILHFNIVQFTYAFLLGIVFALFVERTGKLLAAVVAHVVANTIAVVRTETGWLSGTVDGSVSAWLISGGLLLVGIGMFIIFIGKIIHTKKDVTK